MRSWAKTAGTANPLEAPLPYAASHFDADKAPLMLPGHLDPTTGQHPFQVRDKNFVMRNSDGTPIRWNRAHRLEWSPKMYTGASAPPRPTRCLAPLQLPGINFGMGGWVTLSDHQKSQLLAYPPAFPGARRSRASKIATVRTGAMLPENNTFGFGFDVGNGR
eukprot:TRINITY_DN7825_c0_g1_i2.p3 TRINITY_DN7825_c0_g1~~TRINITY_DN7825_c0_g1_i2.p3  ORF type:complete len:162 (+),score=20.87 TRINITY_DN7825_c0_g1_i2:223-708(+)